MDALHRLVWLLRENGMSDVQGFVQDSMKVRPGVDFAIHASHSHHLGCLPRPTAYDSRKYRTDFYVNPVNS
jgi:hypothetical protein